MNKIITLTIATLILGLAVESHASSLMSKDFSTPGDGLLTYDSNTGLSWLDIPLTLNQSYNDIISGYDGYTTAQGFRYASVDEVGILFSDAGVVQGTIWGYWNFSNPYYLASFNLVSLLGVTYPFDGLTTGTYGLTESIVAAGVSYNNHADSGAFQAWWGMTDSDRSPYVGSFLVKDDSTIPLPSTMLLIGIGGAVFFRHKNQKGTRRS